MRIARAAVALSALGAGALAAAATIDELEVMKQHGLYSLEANARLDATPESIYAVLTDFDDNAYSRISRAYKESRYLEPAGDGKAKVTGDLTLRGVTKEITIDAAYVGGGADPWGGNRTGFTGKTSIALADFGITFNLGPASKEVELTLDIEGVENK